MALDLYCGTLTRYYAGNWKNMVQQIAEQNNQSVTVVRTQQNEDAITDPDTLKEIVDEWMFNVSEDYKQHLSEPISWMEDNVASYETDRPGWDTFGALLLWACYAEQPERKKPVQFVENWQEDEAFQTSIAEDFPTKFGQLILGTELWLPTPFAFVFKTEDAGGNVVWIGSTPELQTQLNELNEITWRASASDIASWRNTINPSDGNLEEKAKYAFAIFNQLCAYSIRNNLPLKMDY